MKRMYEEIESNPQKKQKIMKAQFDSLIWSKVYSYCSQNRSFALINKNTYSVFLKNLYIHNTKVYKCIFRHYHQSLEFLLKNYQKLHSLQFTICLYCTAIENRNAHALDQLIQFKIYKPKIYCTCIRKAIACEDDIYIRLMFKNNIDIDVDDLKTSNIVGNESISVSKCIASHEKYGRIMIYEILQNAVLYSPIHLPVLLDTPYVTDSIIRIILEFACTKGELESVRHMIYKQRVRDIIIHNQCITQKIMVHMSLLDCKNNKTNKKVVANVENIILLLITEKLIDPSWNNYSLFNFIIRCKSLSFTSLLTYYVTGDDIELKKKSRLLVHLSSGNLMNRYASVIHLLLPLVNSDDIHSALMFLLCKKDSSYNDVIKSILEAPNFDPSLNNSEIFREMCKSTFGAKNVTSVIKLYDDPRVDPMANHGEAFWNAVHMDQLEEEFELSFSLYNKLKESAKFEEEKVLAKNIKHALDAFFFLS